MVATYQQKLYKLADDKRKQVNNIFVGKYERKLYRELGRAWRHKDVVFTGGGGYIVDFRHARYKVIIEVWRNNTQWRANQRDIDLWAAGYVILRFTNGDVNSRISTVKEIVESTIYAVSSPEASDTMYH